MPENTKVVTLLYRSTKDKDLVLLRHLLASEQIFQDYSDLRQALTQGHKKPGINPYMMDPDIIEKMMLREGCVYYGAQHAYQIKDNDATFEVSHKIYDREGHGELLDEYHTSNGFLTQRNLFGVANCNSINFVYNKKKDQITCIMSTQGQGNPARLYGQYDRMVFAKANDDIVIVGASPFANRDKAKLEELNELFRQTKPLHTLTRKKGDVFEAGHLVHEINHSFGLTQVKETIIPNPV